MSASIWLRACRFACFSRLFTISTERRVRARGLQNFLGNRWICRPGALTGRVFQRALSRNYSVNEKARPHPGPLPRGEGGRFSIAAGASPFGDFFQRGGSLSPLLGERDRVRIRRNHISRFEPLNRSADWQSAVSRIGNPQRPGRSLHPADCQSAIQQVANLRYGRFMVRARPCSDCILTA